jgi:hypothetical protein
VSRLLVAVLLAVAAPSALAASPRWGSLDLSAGTYRPDIDSEFTTTPGEFERYFGSGRGWMFQLGVSRALFTGFGSLEVGLRTGFFRETAKGYISGTTTRASGADTSLTIVPTSAMLTYRFDYLTERWRIPLAPYGRAAFERFNWSIADVTGGTAKRGATMGWSATGGVAFLLDIVDPMLARELDADTGVNHTYLFFEVTKSSIDDFGASSSWDLSDEELSLAGGLMFVF